MTANVTNLRSSYLKGTRTPATRMAQAVYIQDYRLRTNPKQSLAPGALASSAEACEFCRLTFSGYRIHLHERVCRFRG